jgi:enamine deaminase RidA (YjgF/YER057c/UK114 family)
MDATSRPVERLEHAGLHLPPPPLALGSYVAAVRVGDLVFTSGQLPLRDGALIRTGIVGRDVTAEEAALLAEQCALNTLAAAQTVCDLGSVVRVVKVTGYVASDPAFTAQPMVINGASDVMKLAFGEAGSHAREAVGVAALPLGAPVEISVVLQVE